MNTTSLPTDVSAHVRQLVSSCHEGSGLPRAFYHDPVLYAYEMERIWRNGWIFAGHTCQIPQPGDFFTFSFENDSLILIRDDDAQIRAVNSTAYRPGPLSQKREYNLDAFLRWYLRQLVEERS